MSTAATKQSRWLAWKPKAHISHDSAGSEPTKPSKPSSVGFEGATSAHSPEMEAVPDLARISRATDLLNQTGVRIMTLEAGATIGVWSDLDGPGVRAVLRTLGMSGLPVRYLDGDGIPMRYKLRRVEGEPVPMNVLAEMERNPSEPWSVRDRTLKEMGWCPQGKPYETWKAEALTRMFREHNTRRRAGGNG